MISHEVNSERDWDGDTIGMHSRHKSVIEVHGFTKSLVSLA